MTQDFNIESFVTESNNVLIAPAGFGKTHTISECLKHTQGKQLILTHTQAGVASIKDKLQEQIISRDKYHVETISSFAQRYVYAFHNSNDIPDITNAAKFYSFLTARAAKIFSLKLVKDVIKNSYSGLFVDEYQDCTITQHTLILILADILPTHLFGDPLQGIFSFSRTDPLVNLEDSSDMRKFSKVYKLRTPHRWIKGGNPQLGTEILQIRDNLLSRSEINLFQFPAIEFKQGSYSDHYNFIIQILTKNKSVLVIHPTSNTIAPRQKFVSNFKYIPLLIESLDHKDFYNWASHFDDLSRPFDIILDKFIIDNLTNLENWYNKNNKKFKRKNDFQQEKKLTDIKRLHTELQSNYSKIKIQELIRKIIKLDGVNCTRGDLLNSVCVSLENAHSSNITVLEAMKNHRNSIRKRGRKLYGKCIGTTLLTKGLEFDTVIVLEAHSFQDPRNLYVALSRCTKRLVVISDTNKLNPYLQ